MPSEVSSVTVGADPGHRRADLAVVLRFDIRNVA